MLYNYLKIALRNIKRHTSYTIINVSGLALGIACSIMVFAIVRHHLSFDNFHQDSDRIYRIVTEQHRDQVSYQSSVPNPLGKVLREDYTFSEKIARICTFSDIVISAEKGNEVIKFKEPETAFVETDFFDIFSYPLLQGGTHTAALKDPGSAIITENAAKKYFGEEDPMGKIFRFDNKMDFKVTGILRNLPDNTMRKTEVYLSYASVKEYNEWFGSDDSWGGISSQMQCFVKLKPGVTTAEVEQVMPAYVKKFRPNSKNVHHYKLQPLEDIHFSADYDGVMEKKNLWVFSFIGFFMIVTACVNFINLATAQAIHRSKEVGIRKVLGSVRGQLFWQFIAETGIITIMATVIALAISTATLPVISSWFNAGFSINLFSDQELMLFISGMIVVVTFLSGSYPGLILAGFKPVLALKSKISHQQIGGFKIRRTLIVTQFAISQILIIGLIVIIYQLHYAKQSDMGFTKDAIVMIPVGSHDTKMNSLKNELAQIPGVEKISLCFTGPASDYSWNTSLRIADEQEEQSFSISFKGGDENYLSTFDLKLIAGRNITPSDTAREFVVNQTFVNKLNLEKPSDALGLMIKAGGGEMAGPIVGIVEDFHDASFHGNIHPIFIAASRDDYNFYAVKINSNDMKQTLALLDQQWSETYPDQIYEYKFLDDSIAEFYQTEETMLNLIKAFSCVAIFIGCMGLYGLVSFMAAQKTKEIGIRKVLGGSITHILWIFGKEFALLIVIAFVIAGPISWWLMNEWLQKFAYKINLSAWIFLLSISITAIIALITVGYQSLKAALMNPASSLRAE